MTNKLTSYTPEYIEKCFTVWYSSGRVPIIKLSDKFPADESGRVPNPAAINRWRVKYGWDLRADELDAKAISIVEDDLVSKKAEMLKQQAEIGFQLQTLGMAYLKEDGFDSSSAAVNAVIRGAELERTSRGIGELIVRMSQMSDDDLKAEVLKQLSRAAEANQIIEAEEVGEIIENEDRDEQASDSG